MLLPPKAFGVCDIDTTARLEAQPRRSRLSTPGDSPNGLAAHSARLCSMALDVDPSALELEPQALTAWMTEDATLQLVDVREGYERAAGHIPGSVHIALAELPTRADELDAERPVVFYCRIGSRSEMAAKAFRASGRQAHSLSGGLRRWAQEERPLAPEGGTVAEH